MSDDVEIVGMQAVFQILDKQLGDIRDAANNAVQGAGVECQMEAKLACPVDTGRLRSSIQYNPGNLEATVGTNTEYAKFVEFGTVHQRAQPFMVPAFELGRKHLEEELKNL